MESWIKEMMEGKKEREGERGGGQRKRDSRAAGRRPY